MRLLQLDSHLLFLALLRPTGPSGNTHVARTLRKLSVGHGIHIIGSICMSGTHISHIPYRMYRRFDGSPQITGKPHIHGDIVSTVIPSIIRYQLQSSRNFTIHLTSLGWQSDGRDTFQQTFAKRFHFPLLTNLFDDVIRSRIGIVGLLGTIHQRTSGDADTVAVRLNQFMSNRITDRHRKFQCHFVTGFPMTLDRQIAIGRPCAHLAAIHRSTYLG